MVKQHRSTDGTGRSSTLWGLPLALGLYALCAASLAGACLYFFLAYVPGRRAAVINGWQQELALRADLRKATLDRWVAVGMADAETLASFPSPRALIASGAGAAATGRLAENVTRLREVVESFTRIRGYQRFVLLDFSLRVAIETGESRPLEPSILQAAAEVLARGKTAVDFHRHADGSVAVGFLARVGTTGAPRANDGGGLPSGGGVVLLETDPSQWLYPYLAMRPMAAASAETLLVKGDGDDIVFLSPLRHNPAPPLTFRRPANAAHFAAAAALKGRGEVNAFVDYRNEPVLAAVARLDRAPWGIVVKVDQREALATYQQEIRQTGATAAFAFLGLWAAAFLLVRAWRRRAEQRLETEHSLLRAIINRPDDVIVFSLDPDYCYTVFNEKHRLEMKKVWNVDIRVGMNLLDCMTAPELRRLAKLSIDRALHGEAFWEEQHQPNLDIYYEFSWNPILLGKKIIGVAVFIRDITERRRAEVVLRNSEAELRAVLNATPFPVALVDVDDNKIEFWSRSALTLFGHTAPTTAEWYQLAYPDPDYRREVIERWKPLLEKAHSSGETVNTGEYRVTCRDGSVRLCELYATFLPDKLIVTFNDITERKRAEAALRQSEDLLSFSLSTARTGAWELDLVDHSAHRSLQHDQIFGYRELLPEWTYEMFTEHVVPEDREAVDGKFRQAIATGGDWSFECRILRRDGVIRWIWAAGRHRTDDSGRPRRMAGIVQDITERKQAEQALLEARETLERRVAERTAEIEKTKGLLDETGRLARVGGWELDVRRNVLTWTEVTRQIHDVAPDYQPSVETAVNFYAPEAVPVILNAVQMAIEGGKPYDVELPVITATGRRIWVRTIGKAYLENGTVARLGGAFQDITDRKTKEEEIRLSRQRLDLHVKHTPLAVIEFTRDGHIARWNPAAAEIFGFSEEEAVGQHWTLIAPEEVRGHLDGVWEGLVSQSGGGRSTNLNRHKSGRTLHCEWFNTPLVAADGTAMGVASLVMDVTERNLVQEELARHRDHLQELVQARTAELQVSEARLIEAQRVARVGNWEWDVVSDAISASEEFYRLFDVEPERIARYQQFVECLHPDDRERVGTEVNEALRQNRVYDTDYRVRLRDGRWRDIHARGELFTDADGKPVRLAGTCLDITERRRAEGAVRESEARYRATLYSIGDAVIATDAESRVIGMNPVAERLTGWLESEAEGKPLSEVFRIVNEDTRAAVESPVTRVLREGQVVGLANHTLLIAKDGRERPIADSGAPIRAQKGETTGVVLVFRDQTEERRAGDALRRSEAILRAVIEGTTNLVCVKDQQGRIIIANSAMTHFISKPESEIIGKSDLELVADAQQAAKIVENDRRIMASGASETVEETGAGVAGRWDYLFTKSPYHDLDGQVIGVIGIGTDITERKQAEAEVRRLNTELEQRVRDRTAQLEESNKELEAFSYSVSHDLRAPLRAIDGFTRILADDYASHLDTEGKRLCSVVRENTKGMSRLIDDLLAFSRLGRADMSLSPIEMGTMANSIFHELTTPESRARIDFQVGPLPPAVADPTLMRQVWMNLLSNAIKFSSKRQRAVIRVNGQQGQGECVYSVQDNGAGFDMQYVSKVFGVFQRLHSSKEFEGTGVGLALVQRVIRRHGGRVWAQGEIDKGATFCFALQQRGA